MTRYELLSVIVSFDALFVSIMALLVFVRQLHVLFRQVAQAAESTRLGHERRRRQATLEFYATTLAEAVELREILPYDRNVDAIRQLLSKASDEEDVAGNAITDYLSLFELLAAGVRTDTFSFPVVEAVAGGRILAIAENYRPWIENRQRPFQNRHLYEYLEWLAREIARHRNDRAPRMR